MAFRSCANRRQVDIRKIGIGSFRGIRFPENLELTSGNRTRQTWGQEAVIVVGIDPDRPLWRIVTVICGRAPDRSDVGRARAADRTGKAHDADVSRLSVDREVAVRAVTSLPPLDKSAIF